MGAGVLALARRRRGWAPGVLAEKDDDAKEEDERDSECEIVDEITGDPNEIKVKNKNKRRITRQERNKIKELHHAELLCRLARVHLVNRALEIWPLHCSDLDDLTFGKPGVATSQHSPLRSHQKLGLMAVQHSWLIPVRRFFSSEVKATSEIFDTVRFVS